MGITNLSPFEATQALKDSGVVLASIWAQDRTRVLGSGTDMLWHVPADFRHFQTSTMGSPIIMGRRSWQALGAALPGRTNIVVTRDRHFEAPGGLVVHSLDEAFLVAGNHVGDSSHVWVTGGAHLYADVMGIVDELVVTDLDLDVVSTVSPDSPLVRAPFINEDEWAPDPLRSDSQWRERSGDARWKVTTWVRVRPR
ncbi:dihydrofolate reductase [Schaalia sp. ZJ1691]|uniref:dihydrofolate reductase n=1 Tax=Schaalia sp. ZJ1691 TaxID=2709404 RepID=UPI0013EB2A23|nr:dihydrofolate reductase [Schaalia sp. ZJ1691]